mmetsp:Transcript_10500/g.23526  ORF Transcript_10500/g.23526 Transcript_10500/m.23526 type:complete len:385 (+) Transcript_10500:165-1319(+)
MKIAISSAILLLQLLACPPAALAKKKDKLPVSRDCEFEQKKDEVEFKCKAESENEEDDTELKDEIKFKIKSKDNMLNVKVEYESEVETADMETESETQYEVTFDRLYEYRKSNTSTLEKAYDFEEDWVVQRTDLEMGDISQVTQTEDNLYTFSIMSTDNVATFTFKISVGGENSTDLMANKMKIDVTLEDYPWMSDDTQLALVSTIETKRKIEVEYDEDDKKKEDDDDDDSGDDDDDDGSEVSKDDEDDGEVAVAGLDDSDRRNLKRKNKETTEVKIDFSEALSLTGINVFGDYTWAKDALSNDTTIEVIGTSPLEEANPATGDGKTVQTIAFSFLDASESSRIFWDPAVGVASEDDDASGAFSFMYSGSVAGIAAVLVAALVV